jgi:hypothetical protein
VAAGSIPINKERQHAVKAGSTIRRRRREAGIALLIAIFVLLLISVVAIALVVSSGTESALAGNYRSATGVYYAALAGLEEARGRLASKNSNSFNATAPGFLPAPGTPLAVGHPIYIINPVSGETVAPWDPSSTYPDTQFNQEFSSSGYSLPNPSPSTPSLSTVAGVQGPLYKWVRINAVSEKSLNLDVAPFDGTKDFSTPVYYDGTQLNVTNTGTQVLEITSLAVLPNGSQKLLQYLAAPINLNLSFNGALTLDSGPSTGVNFGTSGNSDFWVNGKDHQNGGPPCSPTDPPKYAVLTTNLAARGDVTGGIPSTRNPNYVGINPTPSVAWQSLAPPFQSVAALDNISPPGLVQTISAQGVADHVIAGPATTLPDFGSPTRMVTTVVQGDPSSGTNGDLTLSGTVDGYGLLVVTGNLNLSGGVSWHGIILVIGQGILNIPGTGNFPPYGYGSINGAVLVARTRHSDYSLRTGGLGTPTFSIPDVNWGNQGFWYDSCSVKAALPFGSYKVLSFHEISQ